MKSFFRACFIVLLSFTLLTGLARANGPGDARCQQISQQVKTETDRLEKKQKQFFDKKKEEIKKSKAEGAVLFAKIDSISSASYSEAASLSKDLAAREKDLKAMETNISKFSAGASDDTTILGKTLLDMKKASNSDSCQKSVQSLVDRLNKLKQQRRDETADMSDFVAMNEARSSPALEKLKAAAVNQTK